MEHAQTSVFSRFHMSEVKGGFTLIALMSLYLFDEADETPPEAPRLVAIALQRADGDLLRLLHRHSDHMHGVVHQRRIRLQNRGNIIRHFYNTCQYICPHDLLVGPFVHLHRNIRNCVKSRVACFYSLVRTGEHKLGVMPAVNAPHKWHSVSAC